MTNRPTHCPILITIAMLLSATLTPAQTRSHKKQEVNSTAAVPAALKFSDLLAQSRRARRAGFALMPLRSSDNASAPGLSFTMMAGPNLAVLGSGTVGRLTKWTGITSSNSFIGDSTIFESKFGLVGIGTDTPTSKLTVAGVIESTIDGFKFPDGSIQTTSAAGSLFSVVHDATLTGNGTAASPLGVAVPFLLSGAVSPDAVIRVMNTADEGIGLIAEGGGDGSNPVGGRGVAAFGGMGVGEGGSGVSAFGGSTLEGAGGAGILGRGGFSDSGLGGDGVVSLGGNSNSGNGGKGVSAVGGSASGSGNTAGIGIEVVGGAGFNGASQGLAGRFFGDVEISGTLSKGGGSFKIDHPLDPENRYLYHSFVESPDMKNIYDGNIVTDDNGEAIVTLPEYFEALNRDFRYQLTVIGTFAQAIVAEEINGNRFVIRTSAPNLKVSWQVTGIRQDRWAEKNRIPVEMQKPERERGYYLHPEAFNQPEERNLGWARRSELMRQRKQRQIESKQKPNNE